MTNNKIKTLPVHLHNTTTLSHDLSVCIIITGIPSNMFFHNSMNSVFYDSMNSVFYDSDNNEYKEKLKRKQIIEDRKKKILVINEKLRKKKFINSLKIWKR